MKLTVCIAIISKVNIWQLWLNHLKTWKLEILLFSRREYLYRTHLQWLISCRIGNAFKNESFHALKITWPVVASRQTIPFHSILKNSVYFWNWKFFIYSKWKTKIIIASNAPNLKYTRKKYVVNWLIKMFFSLSAFSTRYKPDIGIKRIFSYLISGKQIASYLRAIE